MARFGPHDGSLLVNTFREGLMARAGHDLVLEVTGWDASLDDGCVELTADPGSLRVREGLHGIKPLTDRDRAEILRTIDEQVLQRRPIAFSGTVEDRGDRLAVDGDLTVAGTTRGAHVDVRRAGGRLQAKVTLRQTDWGITPYRGLRGALKVRDEVEIVLDVAG